LCWGRSWLFESRCITLLKPIIKVPKIIIVLSNSPLLKIVKVIAKIIIRFRIGKIITVILGLV